MLVDCEKDVHKMIDEASSEHLQPMKEKMEHFIIHVKKSLHDVNTKLSSIQEHFNKVLFHQWLKLCVRACTCMRVCARVCVSFLFHAGCRVLFGCAQIW